MAGNRRNLAAGAVAGAALVAVLAAVLGELVLDLAHPAVVVAFVLFGAVLGAFAWGAVAYDGAHRGPEPTASYREGVLAEPDAEPESEQEPELEPEPEPGPGGVLWLVRHRASSLLRLPLSPWI